MNNLAQLLQDTNRHKEAEPLLRRALVINEASYGPEHPRVATALTNLATLLQDTNRLPEAELRMRRALDIDETNYSPEHPAVATDLNNLAHLLQTTNRLAEAEPLMRRHLKIFLLFAKNTGHEHPHAQAAERNYRDLLKKMNVSDAEAEARVAALRSEVGLGSE
jgi:tetratricopeptide (TPR) repeat protein